MGRLILSNIEKKQVLFRETPVKPVFLISSEITLQKHDHFFN